MDNRKAPSDKPEFKLITSAEHEYIEDPAKFMKSHEPPYQNPDAIKRQFNARIRYRSINAVHDLLFIVENLPAEQLVKVFADDTRIIELFKITEKALAVAGWKPYTPDRNIKISDPTNPTIEDMENIRLPQANRMVALEDHMEELSKRYFDKEDLDDHNELKKEFGSPSTLHHKMFMDNVKFEQQSEEIDRLKNFLKVRNLKEEYEVEVKRDLITLATRSLEKAGYSEEDIEDYIKKKIK